MTVTTGWCGNSPTSSNGQSFTKVQCQWWAFSNKINSKICSCQAHRYSAALGIVSFYCIFVELSSVECGVMKWGIETKYSCQNCCDVTEVSDSLTSCAKLKADFVKDAQPHRSQNYNAKWLQWDTKYLSCSLSMHILTEWASSGKKWNC